MDKRCGEQSLTTNTTRLFQYIHMTEKQEQLSLLYLQTKEEEILKRYSINDNSRSKKRRFC